MSSCPLPVASCQQGLRATGNWQLVTLLAFFLAACDDVPRHEVTLTFDDSAEHVTIAAETRIPEKGRDDARAQRLREDLVAYRDEWSLRFANASPAEDRMLFERSRGVVVKVEHVARIDADDLQKFFFDVPISTTVTRGPGWAELNIYPGASQRATRQQREDVEKRLQVYARRAVDYFAAVRAMYAYLDEQPQRAAALFHAIFREEDDPCPLLLSDVEMSLVTGVTAAIAALAFGAEETQNLERETDLVFNPFPATLVVRVPTEPLLVEGFTRGEGGKLVAQTKYLLDAVASLEGKWISPDPLAFAIRSDSKALDDLAPLIAAEPRRAEAVIGAREVAEALRERLRPAARYRVRFITRAEAREP
jgi:hypothetical protein